MDSDKYTLEDYILNERLIDNINIVFFAIEGNLLPWSIKSGKIAKFFSICKKADKPIFGMGGAMQFLAYYCATNMLQCEVINGNEKGSDISKIEYFNQEAQRRRDAYEEEHAVGSVVKNDPKIKLIEALFPHQDNFVFLDHSNGDYYCYNTPTIDVNLLGKGAK